MITAVQVNPEQELAALCGVLNASYARLVAIVAQALNDESWAIAGVRSPEHWLTMCAGLSPVRARQIVAVARRHGELPSVMGQFADGQLSLDQVTVVARYAPAHVEASVAELAIHASVPQLRRALSRYSFDPPNPHGQNPQITTFATATSGNATSGNATSVTEAGNTEAGNTEAGGTGVSYREADKREAGGTRAGDPPTWNGFALVEDRATTPAELSMSHDEWGRFTLRLSAPADLGALVEAALKEAKDALFATGRPEVTWADAMVEIANRSLDAIGSINRRDAYRTYIHLDTEGGWLTGRPRLPAHLTAKLTCDGIIQPVWHTQGAPVNVGRAQRIVPTRTRRLVEDRDRGCRFPGCASNSHVECHHLTHWADGGPTDTFNLACLCPYHHDTHHDGDFTITGDADNPGGLTFTTRGGFAIRPGPTFTTPATSPRPLQPVRPQSPQPVRPQSPLSPSAGTCTGTGTGTGTGTEPCAGLAPAQGPPPSPSYRGPTGETLNLRWVTFHEPREPAFL
jgi:hypothetical protein